MILRALCLLVLAGSTAAAQTYDISWRSVSAGGALGGAGGSYVVDFTAGQAHASGPIDGDPYELHSGFWALIAGGTGGAQADLSVTKTDGQATAVPGLAVVYTITVANGGPGNVSAASVLDAVPAILTAPTWTCSPTAGSVCTPSGVGDIVDSVDILVGGTLTYMLAGTLDPAATGTLTNATTVAAPAGVTDPLPANNAATDVDTLTPQADLSLTLADAPDPVAAERPLTYTLEVANLGPSSSSGMTLTDTLPAEVAFSSSIPGAPECVEAAGTVTCSLGGLPPSASHSVTIRTVVVPMALGAIGDTATVAGNEPDPASANDAAAATTLVVPHAEGEVVHGTSLRADLAAVGTAPDQDLFRLHQGAHASYEVVVDAISGAIGAGQGPALERVASDTTMVLQSSLPAGAGHSRSLSWANLTGAPVDDEYARVRSLGCASDCDGADAYTLRSYETTYAIPRFNNSGTQVTVLVIQNVSPRPIAGEIAFWAAGTGALLHARAFSVAGHGLFVLATAGVPALQGQSGSVTVAHDGPYGSLAGKVVALEPATGFTFDSEMAPRKPR